MQQREDWSLNTVNAKTNNMPAPTPPTLPVRRKKAMAKKPSQQLPTQQQQHIFPVLQHPAVDKWKIPQFMPKANPRSQNFTAADLAAVMAIPDNSVPTADMLTASIDSMMPF